MSSQFLLSGPRQENHHVDKSLSLFELLTISRYPKPLALRLWLGLNSRNSQGGISILISYQPSTLNPTYSLIHYPRPPVSNKARHDLLYLALLFIGFREFRVQGLGSLGLGFFTLKTQSLSVHALLTYTTDSLASRE